MKPSLLSALTKTTLTLTALTTFLATAPKASAVLIAADSFDYSTGNLNGLNGGTGWGGAWGVNSSQAYSVVSPGLTYAGLATSGNAASIGSTGKDFRDLSTTVSSSTSSTVYISFLLSQSTVNYGNVGLYNGTSELVSFGDVYNGSGPSATYGMNASGNVPGGGFKNTGVAVNTSSTPQLLVMEVDYSVPNQTSFYLFLNPTLGTTPLTSSAVAFFTSSTTTFSFNRIRMEDNGGVLDEIRVGTTFSDVTPVPEPAGAALALFGAGLLFTMRRVRRRQA